jgi:protein RecA
MASVDKNDKDTNGTKDAAKAATTLTAVPAVAAAPALPPRDAARDKAIDLAVSTIEKQFGKGSIMRLGEDMAAPEVKVVPTGSLGLDIALGVGGLPRGRIVEIYGPESSGKTTLALHVVGEAQKAGGICAFVDAEHALDVSYARKLGVRTDDLLVSQPDCGEQALEITEMLVRSGAVDIVVVDSVAALTPKAELEGEMGDAHVGLQARLMSQALRKLTGTISKSNTLVIFINQIRMKIGVMFGNPETTTGGNAPAVPGGRVRHHVRRGHQPHRRPGRPGQRVRGGREVGRLVQRRRGAHRSGAGQRQAVPARAPRPRPQDRDQGARPPRHQAGRRTAGAGRFGRRLRGERRCNRTSPVSVPWPSVGHDRRQARQIEAAG